MERAMRIFKLDDSLVVQLPEPLVEQMGLSAGDDVNVTAADHRTIAISKAEQDRDFLQKLRALQKPAPEGLPVQKEDRRKAALERLASLKWEVPPDYKFDRDEANER
jgi:antitoxin MazE